MSYRPYQVREQTFSSKRKLRPAQIDSHPTEPDITGAFAAWCRKERTPQRWLTLVPTDSDPERVSRDKDQLANWWTEVIWKDSLCLTLRDVDEEEFDDTEDPEVAIAKQVVAVKAIVFDEYRRVVVFGTFSDGTNLHFLAVHGKDDNAVRFQTAISWLTRDFKKLRYEMLCTILSGKEGEEIAHETSELVVSTLNSMVKKLDDWMGVMQHPIDLSTPSHWSGSAVELCRKCAESKGLMKLLQDLVTVCLTRYRTVLIGVKKETLQQWVQVIGMFLPLHRLQYSTSEIRNLEDEPLPGLHLQALVDTVSEGQRVDRSGRPTWIDDLSATLPFLHAVCVVDVDEAIRRAEQNTKGDGSYRNHWLRVTRGITARKNTPDYGPVTDFSVPHFVKETVVSLTHRISALQPAATGTGNRTAQPPARAVAAIHLLLAQWRQQLLVLTTDIAPHLRHTKNESPEDPILVGLVQSTLQFGTEQVKEILKHQTEISMAF